MRRLLRIIRKFEFVLLHPVRIEVLLPPAVKNALTFRECNLVHRDVRECEGAVFQCEVVEP